FAWSPRPIPPVKAWQPSGIGVEVVCGPNGVGVAAGAGQSFSSISARCNFGPPLATTNAYTGISFDSRRITSLKRSTNSACTIARTRSSLACTDRPGGTVLVPSTSYTASGVFAQSGIPVTMFGLDGSRYAHETRIASGKFETNLPPGSAVGGTNVLRSLP